MIVVHVHFNQILLFTRNLNVKELKLLTKSLEKAIKLGNIHDLLNTVDQI